MSRHHRRAALTPTTEEIVHRPVEVTEPVKPTDVSAFTRHTLAYPAWIQEGMQERILAQLRELVKGERIVQMPTLVDLLNRSDMTIAKGLIRLGYLRLNEEEPLARSSWEYVPHLVPKVWYAKPTGTRRTHRKEDPMPVQDLPATKIELPEIGQEDTWSLDLETVHADATLKQLIEYAQMLGLEVEVRLRRK